MEREEKEKSRSLRNVALQEDAENIMGGQSDQQGSNGENEKELGSNEHHQENKP